MDHLVTVRLVPRGPVTTQALLVPGGKYYGQRGAAGRRTYCLRDLESLREQWPRVVMWLDGKRIAIGSHN